MALLPSKVASNGHWRSSSRAILIAASSGFWRALLDTTRVITLTVVWTLTWPLCGLAAMWLFAYLWWIATGDIGLVRASTMASWLLAGGALLPFICHEWAHAVVALRDAGVHGLRIECTLWRISIYPLGSMTRLHAILTALSGPLFCASIGVLLWLAGHSLVAFSFTAHLIFLLPCFGDGRAVITAIVGPPPKVTP